MTLIPFQIYPHLLIFFFKEFEGDSKKYAGRECKAIQIPPTSSIGKYIISNLKKIDYPVKNIDNFNIFIEIKDLKERQIIVRQSFFKRENLSNSFLELPSEIIHDINEMMDTFFRTAFFYYISGIARHNEAKIVDAISSFIEEYELYEFEYLNPVQLRALYYRMKNEGGLSRFQDQDMSKSKYRIPH